MSIEIEGRHSGLSGELVLYWRGRCIPSGLNLAGRSQGLCGVGNGIISSYKGEK